MASYLITGTSRGLGLEFVRELVHQGPSAARLIIATTRSQQAPADLQKVIDGSSDRVRHITLDVTNQDSIDNSVKLVNDIVGSSGLDVLINNAGITKIEQGQALGMTSDNLLNIFQSNVVAVHNVTLAFIPLLEAGKAKKLINITSTMGSIGMTAAYPNVFNNIPSCAYNISKAALNSLTVQYAILLKEKGFTVMAVSPGHLQTDLGGKTAPLQASDGAKATLKIVQEAKPEDCGRFRNIYIEGDAIHDGKDPAW